MMGTVLLALGLVLIVEGLVYALAPSFIEDMLAALKALTVEQRRLFGLAAICIGLFLVVAGRALAAG